MRNSDFMPTDVIRRLQHRAQCHLAELIADAGTHDLPPLAWTIAANGGLTGEADSYTYTPAGQREAVRRWADHVGAQVDTEHTPDGHEKLTAGWLNDEHMTMASLRATLPARREGA